jgi:hypothetical protein
MINGDTVNNKLRAQGNSLDMLIRLGFSDEQILDYLCMASLSRHPTDAERSMLLNDLTLAEQEKMQGVDDQRRAALIDMSWALLTSKEFMFNH